MNKDARIDDKILEYFGQDSINTIRKTVAQDLTISEINLFLHNCMLSKLDPLRRQIYAIKRNGSMSIQTSIDGFRLIAERTGKYSPGKDTEFYYDDSKKLNGAKVYVKKMTPDGTWHDISATALLREYNGGRGLWLKMPHVMIEKCAESRALRRAFPDDLSGLYTKEEMDEEHEEVSHIEKKDKFISEEEWKVLDDYLNGNDDLRKELKIICAVDNLRNITNQQLTACGDYARKYKERNEKNVA